MLRITPTSPPYALTPNTVELIPTHGAFFPRGEPVQDPVLTHGATEGVPQTCRVQEPAPLDVRGPLPSKEGKA